MPPVKSLHVAVIGAGPAGIVTARELRHEGHKVVVFERQPEIGGNWVYSSTVESDPLSRDPNRTVIHSSLYKSLRVNFSRELTGYRDFPFVPKNDKARDPRRFPGHLEVKLYLQDFAKEFKIEEMVRLETEVVYVGLVDNSSNKWRVKSKKKIGFDEFVLCDEVYDAVVVCCGRFFEPRVAEIPGIERWPGKQMHSHNYRVPEPLKNQVVILIGRSASGQDISKELAGVAKEVHIALRSLADETCEELPGYGNMWLHSMIERVHEDGSVVFKNGRSVHADVILHCTGYKCHYPFLDTKGAVIVDEDGNRVGPLYKHVFPPALAPWLSFVGVAIKGIPLLLSEYQSKWIAGVLSGRIELPSQQEMMEDVEAFYRSLEASNIPKKHTHEITSYQFEYYDWMAAICGCEVHEEWRKKMFSANCMSIRERPDTFRDEWEDDDLILEAYHHFAKYILNKGQQ